MVAGKPCLYARDAVYERDGRVISGAIRQRIILVIRYLVAALAAMLLQAGN